MEVERPSASYVVDVGFHLTHEDWGLLADYHLSRCFLPWHESIRLQIQSPYGIYINPSESRRNQSRL